MPVWTSLFMRVYVCVCRSRLRVFCARVYMYVYTLLDVPDLLLVERCVGRLAE